MSTIATKADAPSWAPAWLRAGEPAGPAATSSGADDLADLRERAAGLLEALPSTWRAEARAWPEPWRSLWASLAEAGEAEGLSSREADVLAYDCYAGWAKAELVVPKPEADFDLAWSPTLDPIVPEMCRGKAKLYAVPKPARAAKGDRATFLPDDQEAA
jgi:hypothetical protein